MGASGRSGSRGIGRRLLAIGALAALGAVVLGATMLGGNGGGSGGTTDGGSHDGAEGDADGPRAPIAAVELTQRDLSRQLSTSATVQPHATIRLASRTAGLVEAVHLEEGETVEQGEVLVELDVSEARAEHTRAIAQAEQAQQDYQRIAELRERGLVSSSEYERVRTALNVAESERELWETRVRFGRIVSPRDAMVANRYVEPGEAVDARDTLFELVAMDRLVLRLGVSELDVVHLQEGQAVPVRLDAMPDEELEGAIRRIYPVAERDSRLVTVEISLPADAAERGVRPGFLARVRMAIDQRADVLAVPASAIGEDGDERYVYVVEDDRLQRRRIEVGATRGQWTEVTTGLEVGELVLATNPIDMSDGQAVRIVGWRG